MAHLPDHTPENDDQSSQAFHSHLQSHSMNYHRLQQLVRALARRFRATGVTSWWAFHLYEPGSCSDVEDEFHFDAMLHMHRYYQLQQQYVDRAMQL